MQTSSEHNSFYETDKRLLFILLCIITFSLLYAKKAFIESETAVFEFLQDKPEGNILRILDTVQYLTIPIVYLWKFTVISFVIWVGCFMFGYKVTYSNCWTIAMAAEFIFILPELIKLFWFLIVDTDPSLMAVRNFYPLSLINFFDYESLDRRYVYPLKALNLFEIIYWMLLVLGIHYFAKKNFKNAVWIVSASYVVLFVLWLGFYLAVYN